MAGRLCPACRKNVDSPADPKLKPKPTDEGGSRLEAEQKISWQIPCWRAIGSTRGTPALQLEMH